MTCSTKKAVLKNFLRKHLCWSLLLIKMQSYRPANLLNRHSKTGVFPTVITKFLRTAIFKNICERLLLRVFSFFLREQITYWTTRMWRNRSNHRKCSVRKGALRNFVKLTGKHLCRVSFLNKVADFSLQLY